MKILAKKNVSKILYNSLVTLLPIIALLIGYFFYNRKEELKRTFEFSIINDYYIPLIVLGFIILLYFVVVYYCKGYNQSIYFRIITTLYLIIFVFALIANVHLLFGIYINKYQNLDTFIIFNIACYFFLVISGKFSNLKV